MLLTASEGLVEAATATQALTTALSGAATEMTNMVGTIVPVAVPVVTAILVVTFGIKVFKKIAGR